MAAFLCATFSLYHAVEFHLHKAADALKLHGQSFDAEGNKLRQIKWRWLLPATVKKSVVLEVIQIEVIGERVKAVTVVSALK